MRFSHEADRHISVATEGLARRLNRRQALLRGFKGVATATAAVSAGSLVNARRAFADELHTCCNPYGVCPSNPANGGCPSGLAVCKTSSSCHCAYSSGYWVSPNCSPCSHGSGSYRVCTDCHRTGFPCAGHLCTTLSACQCTGCDTPAQVKANMSALDAAIVGA
jgi:hypothetical protein